MIEWKSLLAVPALSALTVIMGMDNVLTVAVITSRLAPDRRARARLLGLGLAFISRLIVLGLMVALLGGPQFTLGIGRHGFAFRELLKLAGGIFLIVKSARQILDRTLQPSQPTDMMATPPSMMWAVLQILFADQIQSMDSLVSVVGIAPNVTVMIIAIAVELSAILFFAGQVARIVGKFPSVQTVAVCALLLVGVVLISEGFGHPIPRYSVYSMMLFSLGVEVINIRMGQRAAGSQWENGPFSNVSRQQNVSTHAG